jgi:hypothetical protein
MSYSNACLQCIEREYFECYFSWLPSDLSLCEEWKL